VTNTLPSSANCGRTSVEQAGVAMSLLRETMAVLPVCINMKQPVPYVFFTMPGATQRCPKSAACWSPAMPAIGIARAKRCADVSATTALDSCTSGSIERGTLKSSSSSASHSRRWMSKSSVREAFVRSVA
jgi:hypothetical protein